MLGLGGSAGLSRRLAHFRSLPLRPFRPGLRSLLRLGLWPTARHLLFLPLNLRRLLAGSLLRLLHPWCLLARCLLGLLHPGGLLRCLLWSLNLPRRIFPLLGSGRPLHLRGLRPGCLWSLPGLRRSILPIARLTVLSLRITPAASRRGLLAGHLRCGGLWRGGDITPWRVVARTFPGPWIAIGGGARSSGRVDLPGDLRRN